MRRTVAFLIATAAALSTAALSITPLRARADCIDSSPSGGVVVRACTAPGQRWVEVRADLAASDVGVRVGRPDERGRTASAWAGAVPGAVAIVSAGPFRFPDYAPIGLTIGAGVAWSDGRDDAALGVLALDAVGGALIAEPRALVPAEPWMDSALSGVPVVRDGVAIAGCAARACERAPRTAIGLSADGRTLILVVAAGWSADAAGVSDPELGALALAAGADDALRTADGATSALWGRPGGVELASSDGAERAGAAFLAVVDRATGVTSRLRGVVEEVGTGAALPAAILRIETTDGALAWEGSTMTTGAYWERTLPVREYIVRASVAGHRTGCKYCPAISGMDTWCSVFLELGSGAETCTAPARGVDAGLWPLGTVAEDGGVDGGGARAAVTSGCSVGACAQGTSRADVAWLAAAFVVVAMRWRRGARRARG